jgi:hypothetical protein
LKVQCIEVEKAVGNVLFHDITQIEKDKFKGPRYKKGHVIRVEDVEILLSLGKKHIYSIKLDQGELHEDDAGNRLARALQGQGIILEGPNEGRYNLVATGKGLLKINVAALEQINGLEDVVVSTLHTDIPVEKGERVAGAKVIPLVVKETMVAEAEGICSNAVSLISVLPYRQIRIGCVITGSEVKKGRIRDAFAPILREKSLYFGLDAPDVLYADDEAGGIAEAILCLLAKGCGLVIITGGMSVDPDDVTPAGIRRTGARIVKYGAPVLPGAMFMLAYRNDIPLIGLPACAMYFKTTVLDVLLPRIVAGEILQAGDIIRLGHGGLCRNCEKCMFPGCSFGKGGH